MMLDNSENSTPKIVDFGLSCILGPKETATAPYGTLSYLAPEVLYQKPYDQRVDLWSLGVITYGLLSGALPFDDANKKEIIRQTLYEPVPFDVPKWAYVSNSAKEVVLGLLTKDFTQRISLEQLFHHPWITQGKVRPQSPHSERFPNYTRPAEL